MPSTHISERVELTVDGEPMGAYLARPSQPGRYPGVIVAHLIFGLTPDVRRIVDRLADLGHVAIAPDLYHRVAPGVELAETDEGRARGLELKDTIDRAGALADVQAALAYLRTRPDATGDVGMVGLSFGGHVAYYAATATDVAVTVALYPGWLTGTAIPLSRPEPTVELTAGIKGRLLFVVGEEDHVIPVADQKTIADRLEAEGVRHEFVALPGVPHAFLSEDAPTFRPEAAAQTWRLIEEALAAALPKES